MIRVLFWVIATVPPWLPCVTWLMVMVSLGSPGPAVSLDITLSVVAPLSSVSPIFVLVFSFFFLRGIELLNARIVVGTLLIVVGVYLITATIYLFVIACTAAMHLPSERGKVRTTGIFDDLKEGFRYVGENRVLLLVTGMAVILFVLGFPYQQVFVPLLATRTLDMGDAGVGFLAGATGVGAVIGSLVVASRHFARPGAQARIQS